jgi:hypothetical protein
MNIDAITKRHAARAKLIEKHDLDPRDVDARHDEIGHLLKRLALAEAACEKAAAYVRSEGPGFHDRAEINRLMELTVGEWQAAVKAENNE